MQIKSPNRSKALLALPTQKKKRRRFTAEEEVSIESYFQSEILEGKKASVQKCRGFLKDNPMVRSPKDIQDKVANIFVKFPNPNP